MMTMVRCWIPGLSLSLGRRTLRVDTAQGLPVTNVFAYNQRSEVTNAAMGASTSSYRYDDIGNRKQATADAALTVYAANALNHYASVTTAGQDVPVAYDADGNMLTNGVWVYTWDAESRMVSAVSEGAVVVSNAYDYLNRRVRKEVYAWDSQSTAYSLQSSASYVWDGWNIAAEIVIDAAAGSTNVHFYTWGLDLSGSPQGAGGVGGLLADTTCNKQPVTCNTYFPCYDANGNVTDYVDASGNLRARYTYSAFGETTALSGDMAGAFTHRFSTKPFDAETGLIAFEQRYFNASVGQWVNRDPIEEFGGNNLLLFNQNDAVNKIDVLGLSTGCTCGPDITENLKAVLLKVDDKFQHWSGEQKIQALKFLSMRPDRYQDVAVGEEHPPAYLNGWDILDLKININKWLNQKNYPGCAQGEACSKTVQVDGKCFYAGSVNYVVFGYMMKLLESEFPHGHPRQVFKPTRFTMNIMIELYKGQLRQALVNLDDVVNHNIKPNKVATADNYMLSKKWANAGYFGWPQGSTSPAADTKHAQCSTSCKTVCSQRFLVYWYPHGEF